MAFQPKHTIVGALMAILSLCAFTIAKPADDPIDKLVAALQKWATDKPQEKVYLHLDKPYYALGDTIWFKGYVTTGSKHQLSAMSGALYVDLINERDSIVRDLKLPITTGMVMGDVVLGDDLQDGNYRIRAYTQWMRNAGEAWYFDKTFTVGSVTSNGIITKADYLYEEVDGKQVLTATLNYSDEQGKPLTGKDILYRIVIDKKVVWIKSAKTDANGNVSVNIANEGKVDLAGAYIRTTLNNSSNKEVIKDFPIKASLSQNDVQLFPESGNMVNGVTSRVAFKAVGVDGLGLKVNGKVVDNENKEVTSFSTSSVGMGHFILRPEAGKAYTANVTFSDGSVRDIPLPKANDNGYVLSVFQPGTDSVSVRISTTQLQASQPRNVGLMVQSGGETIFATHIIVDQPMKSVWLDKKAFSSGIAQFTLFDASGTPLNERVAFIKGNDRLNLDIKPNKSSYKSKEQVVMNLTAKDGSGKNTAGNFSVSVIDESKIPSNEGDETSIFSSLLLTSDIKGYVEKPNRYFLNDDEQTNIALDDLMLTQGYRRFVWQDIVKPDAVNAISATSDNKTVSQYPAESVGIAISGKVETLTGNPAPDASVTLLSTRARITKFATTDAEGKFKFDGIFLTDSIKFAVQARTKKNGDNLKLILDSIPLQKVTKNPNPGDLSTNIPGALKAYIEAGKKQDAVNIKMGRMDRVHKLREVNIRGAKDKKDVYALQGPLRIPEGHADRTLMINEKEMAQRGSLGTFLAAGAIPNITMTPTGFPAAKVIGGTLPFRVILNGRLLTKEEAEGVFDNSYVECTDIIKIEAVITNMAVKSMLSTGDQPVLLIFTKAVQDRKQLNPSMVNTTPKGFNKAREFYSPKYDRPGNAKQLPDMRTTIYWNPYLKTYAAGQGSFNFYNADGPGTYRVTVEGINADGQLGRQVFRYQVDGDLADSAAIGPLRTIDDTQRVIAAALDKMRQKLPIEKVYMHTDKPYYNMGDTLWFKGYVTDAEGKPSRQSGLLYVELDNDSTEAVRRVSLKIKDGMASGQIPLTKAIFAEGGYTLRAYTNWMQNFGEDLVFNQRFYLGVPATNAWLVRSSAGIKRDGEKDRLDVDLKLNRADKGLSSLALKKVEVRIYEGKYYLHKEEMQTGVDGSIKFSKTLKDKLDGRNLRLQIKSLEPEDNEKTVQVPLRINRSQKTDLQFLPESGSMVAGLRSTVGFKAIGEDGKSSPVAGEVQDSKGNKVADFITLHGGMGSFEFTPKKGDTYTARIIQPEGIEQTYSLPKASERGIVLHIDNDETADQLKVSIAASSNLTSIVAASTDSAYYLIGTSGGRIYYSEKAALSGPAISIDKKLFPTGIAKFTLFKGKRPLNQRLVFVDNKEQLNISIIANKPKYAKRDSVGMELTITDKSGLPVQGSFSLAVTDDSQVKPDSVQNFGMAASLLLNSELKGDIEDPGYYLTRKDKQAWAALDNLLLTQGWAAYDWKEVFEHKDPAYKAEQDIEVTGRVVNLANKPVPNTEVIISSQRPSFVTSTQTDFNGRYSFNKLPRIDSGSFFLQANNKNGKARAFGGISVEKFKPMPVPETIRKAVLPWYVNSDTTQLNYVKRVGQQVDFSNMKGQGTLLRNVNIKTVKVIKNSHNRNGPGRQDLVFDEKDIKESAVMNLWQLLRQKLPGITVTTLKEVPTLKLGRHMVVILMDGGGLPIQLNIPYRVDDLIDEISQYQIANFKGMEVMWSDKHVTKYFRPKNDWIMRSFKGQDINKQLDEFKQGGDVERWFYIPGNEPSYLDRRANLYSNVTPEIAIIEITTGNGAGWFKNRAPSAVTYRPLPLMVPQQFYRPKYKANGKPAGMPDYRATLHWEPNIFTDANGKAKISFYTSDLPANYTINIQGITPDGAIGGAVRELNKDVKQASQ
ncbi:carboxypeptidase-like regulatory domain-containing protein [Mucilaginibacter myungsuensis]|uniref:Carboxypeptidase regulatory-like domain-containing protein n=1 Tax=Mucilaginibacter myungsuensis TaxID=649104 RepID=A0A929KSZ2_9SPHI|nr:carboxypeptidase-like regulatory domain-containing protein [Mucilaginibacter myungsuensis]MBE9660971.1 carboxypeptidase regulatory-like domain-containing protein [Mucilaginibacter myungsuensis]MDN3601017.1 carboxypeptidase regulatory-like domain-containing protein [Mucilaginibacter myungsuensis]